MGDGFFIPDGNEALRQDIPAVVELIERTARWVNPETFRRLPIWAPHTARGRPLYDANWTRRYTNTRKATGVTAEKFEGHNLGARIMYEPRVFYRCLYALLAFRDLSLDAFRKRSGSGRPRAWSLGRWPALRISLRNPARPYFAGLLGDRRMLAGPPVQVKRAHAQHRLDFRQGVGESFQRRRQPDHVGDAREIPGILDDRALLSKRRIVVTPDVTDCPILRPWTWYIESGHQRLKRGHIGTC
jgi:hypothetical protein